MIAISYRREDSLPIAGRLYDRLQAKFGKKNVFMDFDSIPPGADFREQIKQMIEKSNLVIAIIGPHWLGEQPDASRRIDNPADFVRLEIAYGLEAGIPVIPLLINATQMPKPEMLPPDIQELAFRHALPLDSGMDFHRHTDRLIAGIGKATDAARQRRRFGPALIAGGKAVVSGPAVGVSAAKRDFRDVGLMVSGAGKAMFRSAAIGFGTVKEVLRGAALILRPVSTEILRGAAVTVIPAALVAICIWYFAIRPPPERIVQQPIPRTQPSQPPSIAGSPSPVTSTSDLPTSLPPFDATAARAAQAPAAPVLRGSNVAGGQTVHMKGVDVNLPTGVSGETSVLSDYVSVSVDKDGHYFFDKDEVSDEELLNRLRKVHESAPEAKLFVRGDRDSVHLNVTHALDVIRSAGFYKISFEIRSEVAKAVPAPKGTETMAVMGIRVNLPAAQGPPSTGVKDFISIKVLEGNAVFFDNQYVADDQVLPRLFELHRANPDIKISLSATPMAIYGDVIGVLDKIRSVGITKVGYPIRAAGGVAISAPTSPAVVMQSPTPSVQFSPPRDGVMSMSKAKALAIFAPRPEYPIEARSRHITGSGVCILTVDPGSGNVTDAIMGQSTGSPILDNSALSAFKRWRFKTGTVTKVRLPITFTMSGAWY